MTEFICSVVGGCLGCFYCLVIINDIAMNVLLYFMCCFFICVRWKK